MNNDALNVIYESDLKIAISVYGVMWGEFCPKTDFHC